MAPAIIPALAHRATTFLTRAILPSATGGGPQARGDAAGSPLGPLAERAALLGRDNGQQNDPSSGVIDPHDINNAAMFVLFGLIGVAFVVTGIWFFFWAKNGGFYFKNDDWDDYKTTVLRRRGPNGTLLSGATPSTQLGGGSVYKDVADDDGTTDDARTTITATTGITGITGGVSDILGREKRRKKREQKDREKERRREEKKNEKRNKSRKVGPDGVLVDEEAEAEAKQHLRSYRHEKPARVGGLNKEADGSAWDGSTNPSNSNIGSGTGSAATGNESTVTSELMNNREHTPTNTPNKKSGGIRKVYSTADRRADREDERIRAEARRLQEKGRSAGAGGGGSSSAPRRNFSYQRHDSYQGSGKGSGSGRGSLREIEENTAHEDDGDLGSSSQIPGGWAASEAGTGSEIGTKSYHHPIPGLSSSSSAVGSTVTATTDFAYQDEKRKKRGGAGGRRTKD